MAGRLENPVIVSGFTELERDLKIIGPKTLVAFRVGMEKGAEPIKEDAGRLSQLKISGMKRAKKKPPPWSKQKIGQNTKEVYMVPVEKGARAVQDSARRRPKFAEFMLGKVYDPALERNRVTLLRQVNISIGSVTRTF